MGNLPKEHFVFHSKSEHPIQGIVPVWSIKQQGKFVMRIKIEPQLQRVQLYEKISKEQSFNLVKYYGDFYKSDQDQQLLVFENFEETPKKIEQTQKISKDDERPPKFEKIKEKLKKFKIQRKSKDVRQKQKGYLFWEFLNYDLAQLIDDIKLKKQSQRYFKTDQLIQLIDGCVNAALIFANQTIFIDFNTRIIQYAASRLPLIYWAHLLPNNMHRSFLKYFQNQQKIEHCFYSPQQLLALSNEKIENSSLISMEKSSVFSLGMVLLECMTLKDSKDLYDYNNLCIHKAQFDLRMNLVMMDKRHGKTMKKLLQNMLKQKSSDRFSFKQINSILYQ